MNVSLKPELERFIEDQVNEGRFFSAAEVLEAGLARLTLDPPRDELDAEDLAAIEESEAQIARGEDLDWKEVSATLRRQYIGA
jgi:putative addiction module CopG family antidote